MPIRAAIDMISPERQGNFPSIRQSTLMKLMLKLMLLVCCVAIRESALAQSNGWTLVWADEFTQTDGSLPNSTKWAYDIGASGWGNNEWQYYSTTNASITNNMLVIEARKTVIGQTTNYSSARLKTQGKASW